MLRTRHLALFAAAAVALPATVWAMQSGAEAMQIFRTFDQSAARIYDFGGSPVKLDTATGAIHSLRGNAGAKGTGGHWWLNVPAVDTSASSMFEVQRAGDNAGVDQIFLVEIRTGETWQLRWRGNQNGAWQKLAVR